MLVLRCGCLRRRDRVGVNHRVEDLLLPCARSRRIEVRIITGWIVGNPGEHRRLGEVEMRRIDAEVRACCGLDAGRSRAVVDVVEVLVEDHRPRGRVDEALGEADLLQLVGDGSRIAEVEDLRQLHWDRAGPLRRAVREVGERRGGEAGDVDGTLGPEGAVLDGDDRPLHERRDVGERDRDPRRSGRMQIRDEAAGAVVHQ